MNFTRYIILLFICFAGCTLFAQSGKDTLLQVSTDTVSNTKNPFFEKDSSSSVNKNTGKKIAKHEPGKATIRSLILPGWGQAYNKRYWEIPIVYGALGVTGAIYLYNNKWYKKTRDAYDIKVNRLQDTALIDPKLQPLSPNSLQVYRNSFRRDRDYSALWFIIFWGLNIVDATVFAHLKAFDVSEDLSLQINPVINWNGSKGIGLAMGFKSGINKERHFILP
jgi:hypothetical protein